MGYFNYYSLSTVKAILKTEILSCFFFFIPAALHAHSKGIIGAHEGAFSLSDKAYADSIPLSPHTASLLGKESLLHNPVFLQDMAAKHLLPFLSASTGTDRPFSAVTGEITRAGCPAPLYLSYDSVRCVYGSVVMTLDSFEVHYPDSKVNDTLRDINGCDSIIKTFYITVTPHNAIVFDTNNVYHVCYGYGFFDPYVSFYPLIITHDTLIVENTGELQNRCGGGFAEISSYRLIINKPYPIIRNIDTTICYNDSLNGIRITKDTSLQESTLYATGCDSSITNYAIHVAKSSREIVSVDTALCDGDKYDGTIMHRDTLFVDSVKENSSCGVSTIVYDTSVHVLKRTVFSLGADTAICAGRTVVLKAPDSQAQYLWNTGQTSSEIIANDSGEYSVKIESDNGCITSDSIHLGIIKDPPFKIPADTAICKGDVIQLTSSGGNGYSWSPPLYLSCVTCVDPLISPDSSIQYQLTIQGTCHAEQHLINITVENPELSIPDSTVNIYKGQQIQLTVNGSGVFTWSPGATLSCSACQSPVANPVVTTTYTVEATEGKCVKTGTVTVMVNNELYLFLPSAFSPNGDGKNDVFRPSTNLLGNYEMWIFNRWGRLVFHSKDKSKGWDGNYHNMPQPIGGYPYLIKFMDANNYTQTRRGTVTLIR